MPRPDPRRTRSFRLGLFAAGLLVAAAAATAPADVAIMKDGFVIQGTVRKELEPVRDPATGQTFSVPRANGFDFMDDGPRITIFSSHQKQLGELAKDVKLRPDYRAFKNPFSVRINNAPVPPLGAMKEPPDFDAKWRRTVKFRAAGAADEQVKQQVTYLDPYTVVIASPTHLWSQTFRTSEMDPKKVRALLATHPELVEADGKPDPLKRVAIARFLKDVGWLQLARDEIAQLKKLVPGALPKDAQDDLDKLQKEMDGAAAELVAAEAEFALAAGRYRYAADVVRAFPEKTADPKDVDRITKVKARLETARDQHTNGSRLLRGLVRDAGGVSAAHLAVGGGPLAALPPKTPAGSQLVALISAADVVLTELHPDSAGRLEFFVTSAAQAEREKSQGKPPTKKPEELLAMAVSGWAKGKNGATPDPESASRIWEARETALAYQRGQTLNERGAVLARYRGKSGVGLDEFAQVVSLLPPVAPEDLAARSGTLVNAGPGIPDGIYRRKSASHGVHPAGIDYLVKLPPEYHHGRAYPVLIVLTYPGLDPERLLGAVAGDADKHGYILVAPDWCPAFSDVKSWQWKGEDHDFVTAALRDVVRHFTVDNDRVFLIGAGEGGDMAMDVGASHPDLFAGVVAMGANPKWPRLFADYWRNAQKLPFYVITGQLAGEANINLRRVYEQWMPNGFPAVQVVYKGRGIEWYPAEIPTVFDWMGRKRRANGVATLRQGDARRFAWQTNREGDNRFYWLGAEKIDSARLEVNVPPGRAVISASLAGDIKGNSIDIQSVGVRSVSVWLGRDMIDWSRPVGVTVNGNRPAGWKPQRLEPDLGVLLEDYWHRGDRRMLYLARIEVPGL